jgi:hypothetical protein
MDKLRVRVAGLVLAVTALAALLLPREQANASSAATGGTVTRQIAVSTLGQDFRATLTAVRGPSKSGAAAATVTVAAYKRSAGEWKLIGRQTVGANNAWLWNVVTGGDAICRFTASDVSPYPIEVRLLVSSSIGCSVATYNYHIDKHGAFVAG